MERAPGGSVFNVGGGDEATMLEAIALLEQVAGETLDVRHVGAARGDVSRTKAEIASIRRTLAWEPTTPLRDGLREMWSWASARVAAA
jgi:nucleoside-diphosphate-sugar epimerase